LNHVLGKLPQKVFHTNRKTIEIFPFNYPYADLTANNYTTSVFNCLDRVLRLTTVGSKRFLTSKVDRSVTGLIAQQQCVGLLHIPLPILVLLVCPISNAKGGNCNWRATH
jgi:phosphoribosylformylglycinamidine synthase